MASSDSSSDSDVGYSNFKKYKKRQLKTVRKANPPPAEQAVPTSSKTFKSKRLKDTNNEDSDESASDQEMTVEQLIAERKKNKPKQEEKPYEIELLDDTFEDSAIIEDKETKDNKKKTEQLLPSPPKKAQAVMDELRCLEREMLLEDQAHRVAVKHIANKIEAPVIFLNDDDSVSVILEVLDDKDFRLSFNMKKKDTFDTVFLDHASKAGYEKPEKIKLLWETEDAYVNIKYFDTPEKLNMPLGGCVKLIISPREGAVREQRNEGEIKIKLNMKSEKQPLERFIHKEMTFGQFKLKICSELKLTPSKIRFTFDGETVDDDSTPASFDMEDFDIVDLHV